MTYLRLDQYPGAIAKNERQLIELNRTIRDYQEQKQAIEAELDLAIASDASLKNDMQRKAQRTLQLNLDEDYQTILAELQSTQESKAELEIELGLLKNQFAVVKLEARERIAQLDADAA